jgi:hypothetical protein
MNDFDKDVLCQTLYEFHDKGEYPTASKLKKITEDKCGFLNCNLNLKNIKENVFQI